MMPGISVVDEEWTVREFLAQAHVFDATGELIHTGSLAPMQGGRLTELLRG